MKHLLLSLCLASWALSMAIISQGMNLDADTISGNPPTTHRTKVAFLPFFTKAPEYIGNALKSPETAWASSRVLPIFWTRILSHDSNNPQDGSDSTASICRAHVGSWACGLLAGVSLLAIAFAGCTLIVLVALCTYNKRHTRGVQLPITEPRSGYSQLKPPKQQ